MGVNETEQESKCLNEADKSEPKEQESSKYTRAEYFKLLEKWLNNVYVCQSLTAAYPYYLLCNQISSRTNENNPPWPTSPYPFSFQQFQNAHQSQNVPNDDQGLQCHIPPMWKRLAAELLDFFILFFLKIALTFIVVDFFDIVDLNKFDFDILQKDIKYDNKVALQMIYELMMLEGIHRIAVCFFETFWLQSEIGQRLGGATPGKSLIGLRVVTCERVTPIQGDEVIVYPGKNLTVGRAFLRSFMKNLIHAIFIPASIGFLYFRYNRFGYDMLCGTVVIEDSPTIRHRLHH